MGGARRLLPPRDTPARDALVAAVALAGGLGLFGLGAYPLVGGLPYTTPSALFLPPIVVAAASLALRRRAPLAALAVATVAFVADVAFGASLATLVIFTQVMYEASVYGPPATWKWLVRISVACGGLGAVVTFVLTGSWRAAGMVTAGAVLLFVFPAVTGLSVRQYRDQAAAERVRAQQTARLAELDRRAAVVAERHRMARELHDVVANHLSAVAIHATAAQAAFGRDEQAVRQALAVIRDSSVRGLAEMRQLIGLLRDSDGGSETDGPDAVAGDRRVADGEAAGGGATRGAGSPDPLVRPRLAEADRLVEALRGAGIPVRFTVVGRARPLPAEVDLAGYRILQESLTNALKHGRGGDTWAEVAYSPTEVTLTVENALPKEEPRFEPAGRPAARAAAGNGRPEHDDGAGVRGRADDAAPAVDGAVVCDPLPGAGAGLVGMRERAELLGGTFTAGAADGRWRVRAVLPVRDAA